jgi:hypothetical protein
MMDECESADKFFEMLPARLELLEQAQLSYKEWQLDNGRGIPE